MSTVTFTLPKEYGYVILSACSSFLLATLHGMHTIKYRREAKIAYPTAYAPPSESQAASNPAAYQFNCAQRSHANFTENHLSTLAAMLIAGVRYPVTAAVLGMSWTIGRYFYMLGYTNMSAGKDGKGRYRGSFYMIGQVGLFGLCVWTGLAMLLEM